MPTPRSTPHPDRTDKSPEIAPADIDALMQTPIRRPPGPWVLNDGDERVPPEPPQPRRS